MDFYLYIYTYLHIHVFFELPNVIFITVACELLALFLLGPPQEEKEGQVQDRDQDREGRCQRLKM